VNVTQQDEKSQGVVISIWPQDYVQRLVQVLKYFVRDTGSSFFVVGHINRDGFNHDLFNC
jgi:hypothetical protein